MPYDDLRLFGAGMHEVQQLHLRMAFLGLLRQAAEREARKQAWTITWVDSGGHLLGRTNHRQAAEHLGHVLHRLAGALIGAVNRR